MPEYLAPGVYVEEVSFRAKSIEGVSTTTTGFVGPTRYGPVDIVPDVITSLVEFERIYGDRQPLVFGGGPDRTTTCGTPCGMFFENGGKRLYVARVFTGRLVGGTISSRRWPRRPAGLRPRRGHRANTGPLLGQARFPGAAGTCSVRITLTAGPNVYDSADATRRAACVANDLRADRRRSIRRNAEPPHRRRAELRSSPSSSSNADVDAVDGSSPTAPAGTTAIDTDQRPPRRWSPPPSASRRPIRTSRRWSIPTWRSTRAHRAQRRGRLDGRRSSPRTSHSLGRARSIPIVDGSRRLRPRHRRSSQQRSPCAPSLAHERCKSPVDQRASRALASTFRSTGGNDGALPPADRLRGRRRRSDDTFKTGLHAFEDIDDISIVAAPGSTFGYEADTPDRGAGHRQRADHPRQRDALPHRRARLRRQPDHRRRARRCAASSTRTTPRSTTRGCTILDPVTQQGDQPAAAAASWPASTRATTSTARSTRRRPTRS